MSDALSDSWVAGDRLGDDLRLVEPLGEGAMGAVWVAHDRALDRRVAVKLISVRGASHGSSIERFKREATLAAKIASPHVVEIYAHGVSETGVPYIVMELLAGRSLDEELADRGPLPVDEVCDIVEQVARGLSAAHQLGVVHRDIKPANLVLVDVPGYQRFVKVVDFGIAKQPLELGGDEDALTATGAIVGTPRYMSPEQLVANADIDHRTDLWALAVVAYQLLTASLPFPATTLRELAGAVTRGAFSAPSSLRPELGTAVDRWFERALRFNPDERFSSIDSFVSSLGEALSPTLAISTDETADVDHAVDSVDDTARYVERAGLELRSADVTAVVDEGDVGNGVSEASEDQSVGRRAADTTADGVAPDPNRSTTGAESTARWWIGLVMLAVVGSLWLAGRDGGLLPVSSPQSSASVATSAPDAAAPNTAAADLAEVETGAPDTTADPTPSSSSGAAPKLAPDVIQSKMRLHKASYFQCYQNADTERALRRTIHFVIDVDGSVKDAAVLELDLSLPDFDECLVERVRALHFPRPRGGVVTVAYPLVFSQHEPLRDDQCHAGPNCVVGARCSVEDDNCAVGSAQDCLISLQCAIRGLCGFKDGRCVADFDDCGPDSVACTRYGLCHRDDDGGCVANSDDDCRAAGACTGYGHCSARRGACAAVRDEDCAESANCRDAGLCKSGSGPFGAGWCRPTSNEDCKASRDCRRSGHCTSRTWRCIAASDADCAQSEQCKRTGRCGLGALGLCRPSKQQHCEQSEQCIKRERCSLVGNDCLRQPR